MRTTKIRSYRVLGKQKRNSFDSLRLLLAVVVIYSHSFPLTQGSNAHEPLARLAAPAMVAGDEITLGGVAVWSFFALSGFLITKSWQRSSSGWSYMKKRFRRIYPGFVVAVTVCALIQALVADAGVPRFPSLWNFLSHVVQLQIFETSSVFSKNPAPNVLNGSLWSIPFEFWCYIGILLLGIAGLLKRRWLIVIFFVLVIVSHAWIDYRHWLPGGMLFGKVFGFPLSWTRVLPFFLAGMFLAVGENTVELRPGYAFLSLFLVAMATPFHYLPYLIYPLFGPYLLIYLAFSPVLLPLNLGRWGDFSYGTYLYAFPIQQLLIHFSHRGLSPVELFFKAAPLSICSGILSWFLVERWFLSRDSEKRCEQKIDMEPPKNWAPQEHVHCEAEGKPCPS